MCRKTILFLILILGNLFGLPGFAQKSSPSGLALEITFFKGRPPAHQSVAASAAEAKWAWYSLFNRLTNFQSSADRLPVRAVKFVPYLEKDVVKINVTVFTGNKSFENEEVVGVYSARENERITIKELEAFGVEPFEIAVIPVAPSTSVLPSIVNKTSSLQVTGIEPNFSTLPSYKITMLNNSEKAISAFTFETAVNGQRQLSGMPQGENGEPLIKAGGEFEKEIPNALENRKSSSEQIPSVQANQTFIISSVIFDDGSYEGNAQSAAQFRAFALGRKLQLKQIIAFIQANEKSELNALAEQALKLGTSVDEMEFNELLKDFPALNENEKSNLRNAVEIASDRIKREFVKDLEMQLQKSASNSVSIWLSLTKEQYQNWMRKLP